jgi:hypothetical protein
MIFTKAALAVPNSSVSQILSRPGENSSTHSGHY